MSNTSATYNVSVKLRKNAFVRTNYNFLYWVYNNSTYADEQSVSNLTTTNGATINMTAQWRGVSSTVSFNSNGTIETTKTVYFAETYGTLPTPTSRGAYWKFMG